MFHLTWRKKRPNRWVGVFVIMIFPLFLIIFLLVPNVPLPETPIDVTDCRLNLLLHIGDMQNEVNTRLESLEGLFEGSFLYCGKFY